MPARKNLPAKVTCLNPETGGCRQIDADTYALFSKAIFHLLKAGEALTFSDLTKGINNCFQEKKIKFTGSVSWYAITVKKDMEARGQLVVSSKNGKKLNRLGKTKA